MQNSLTSFLERAGTIAGITGALLLSQNNDYSAYGYVLFLVSSVCLAFHARRIGARWLLVLQLTFLVANVNGLYHWILAPLLVATS